MIIKVKVSSLLVLALLAANANAVNVEFDAGVRVGEVFTDNVNLEEEQLANSDFITVASPYLTIESVGRRMQSSTNYLLQQTARKNTSGSELTHNIQSNTNIEILEEHLFTNFQLQNGQRNISSNGSLSLDNITGNSSNRQEVLSYQIDTFWRQNIKDLAVATIGFTRNEIFSDLRDSDSDTTYFNIANGRGISKLDYLVSYSNRYSQSEGAQEVRFTNYNASVTYPINYAFSVKGSLGYDDNVFSSLSDTEGVSWRFGGIWHPSTRLNLEAGYGERYFGRDLNIQGRYQTAKSTFRVSFDQSVDLSRDSLLNSQTFNLADSFGELLENPDASSIADLDIAAIDQRNEVVVTETLLAEYNYQHRRNTITATITFSERDFQLSQDADEFFTARLRWKRQIRRNLTGNISLIYQDRELTNNETQNYIVDYSLTRNLGRTFNLVAGFRHALFESVAGDGYFENRAQITLNKSF